MQKKPLLHISITLVIIFSIPGLLTAQEKGPEKLMIYDGNKWKAQLYGFVKLDAVYNDSQVVNPESPLWSKNEKPTDQDYMKQGSFTMSVRWSRLGFKIFGPKVIGADSLVLFEVDFHGNNPDSGTASRQSQIRMRHTYVKLTWPTKTYFLVGNTWMLGFPVEVYPSTIQNLLILTSGSLLLREQQIGLGQTFGSNLFNISIEASAARPQANDGTDTIYPGPKDSFLDATGTGEASEQPSYKGRLTMRLNPVNSIKILIGGAGQYMKERYNLDTDGAGTYEQKVVDSNFVMGFGYIQIFLIKISGQYFKGENIDQFFGGILQGVTITNPGTANVNIEAVKTQGGWGQLTLDLRTVGAPLILNLGHGLEKVDEKTIADGGRKRNTTSYVNLWIYLSKNYKFGIEVAKNVTEYKEDTFNIGDNLKVQSSFMFIF